MTVLLIGHLIGDFYLQTDTMAKEKCKSIKVLLLHCGCYAAAVYGMLCLATKSIAANIFPAIIIGLLHLFIDYVKVGIQKDSPKYEFYIFWVDQILHIAVLCFVGWKICPGVKLEWILELIPIPELIENESKIPTILCSVLLCGRPSAIIVVLVLKMIPRQQINMEVKQSDDGQKNNDDANKEVLNAGSFIGVLEREIILILGLVQQYEAIGFVLAAKSIARHKQLDEPGFAEKYLVGTLLSSLIALTCSVICS